jgi:hypothetical protein
MTGERRGQKEMGQDDKMRWKKICQMKVRVGVMRNTTARWNMG